MPAHESAFDGSQLVEDDELDRFVGPKVRARLEERYWEPIERATCAESFLDDETFFADPGGHPATFSDHGVVHVRDVARRAVRLAEQLDGGLLPSRSANRLRVVQGSAVLMAYLHDIGMVAASPAGRRVHAQFAAQTALGPGFDDLAEELWSSDAAGLRTRIEADAGGGADVPGDVVMRELLALSLCHSKSAVPAQLLDDPAALRHLMIRATFTDLDQQTASSKEALWTAGRDHSAPSSAVARYRNVDTDAFAWLVDPRPAARRFVTDVIDAIRVLRAADALRQRGTTQRTSAGYEVCVDHCSGRAVMAVRSADRRFGAWMWLDNRHSIAEGNLRIVDLTVEGSLRVAFHRGSFGGRRATERVVVSTADMIADIDADVLGSFPRRPGAPRSARLVEVVQPPDDASFARLVVDVLERHFPQLAGRTVLVDQPHPAPPVEAAGWFRRASAVTVDHPEVEGWFEQFSLHGLHIDATDRRAALRDALRVRLRPGEVVLSPGTAASVVLIPLGRGIRVEPIGGYRPEQLQPWLPIGSTGVIRGAERNATVIADTEVDVLVIPAERYLANWFKPYTVDELPSAWRRWLAASEVQPSDPNACGRLRHMATVNVLPSFPSKAPSRCIVKLGTHRRQARCRPANAATPTTTYATGPVVPSGSRVRRAGARRRARSQTTRRRHGVVDPGSGDTEVHQRTSETPRHTTTLERIMVALRPDGFDQGAGSRRQVVYASAHSQRAPGHGADADCLLPWKASDRRVVVIVERAGSGMNVVVNGPRITELIIPKVAATRERVADYGVFIGTDVPDDRLPIPFYQGAVEEGHNLPFQYHHRATVRTARIHPRPSAVTWLERHTRLTQLFVGLGDAPFCLVLGTPNLASEEPDLGSLVAFVFPPAHGVIIHAGTWHDFPMAIDRPVTVLTMNSEEVVEALASQKEPAEMDCGDVFKLDVQRRTGVKVRVAA